MLSEKQLSDYGRHRDEQWNAERLRTGLENSRIHWVTEPRDKRILQLAFEEIERLRLCRETLLLVVEDLIEVDWWRDG